MPIKLPKFVMLATHLVIVAMVPIIRIAYLVILATLILIIIFALLVFLINTEIVNKNHV